MNTEPQTPVDTSRTIASDATVIVQNNGGPLEVLSLPAKSNADYEAEIKMWRDAACSAKEQRNTIIDEGAEKQGRIDYLERELSTANAQITELEQTLSVRTVSCAACNETAVERDKWRECAKNLASDLRSIQFIIQDNENIFGVVTIGNAALAEYTRLTNSTTQP